MSREDNIAAQERLAENINGTWWPTTITYAWPTRSRAPTRATSTGCRRRAGALRRAVQIGRFGNGEIVERWGSTDELGIMQQVGATPQPA